MSTALRPYPEYKDSGVPWLGQVPAHWQQLPGRACFIEKKAPNIGMQEMTVLSLSYGQIVVKPPEKLHGLVPASFETYQIIEPYDIVIRPTDLQNDWVSLRTGLARTRGIITSAYMRLRTKVPLVPEYGHLLLHAYDLKKVFYGLGSGLRQNLSWRDFKYLPCLVPPPDEQAAIARFLDHHDRLTRRYIRAQRRLIELLEEQKQALIQQAVTRGLDPDVSLKDSGVEWLGKIPEHWKVLRSRFIFHEVDKRSKTGEETHLSMSQKLGLVPSSLIEERRLMSESYAGAKLCQKDDLVLNRLKAHLGVFALAPEPGLVSPDYTVLRAVQPISARYYELVLRTPACRIELCRRVKGIVVGFWRLYTEDFYDIALPFPSLEEQSGIVRHVDDQSKKLDEAIERAQRQIDLIREHRTRLIADVVTGKLDVRQAAVYLPEEAEEPEELEEYETEEEGGEDLGAAEEFGDADD